VRFKAFDQCQDVLTLQFGLISRMRSFMGGILARSGTPRQAALDRAALRAYRGPCSVIAGRDDAIVPLREIEAAVPAHVALHRLDRVGHLPQVEAADLVISSMEKSISSKKVTYDFARLMDGATQMSCSGFGDVMIEHM
jgi:pimeloyl-ACP methyl ester carboxylesterase